MSFCPAQRLFTNTFLPVLFRTMLLHTKCRVSPYPRTTVSRLVVPDEYVSWSVPWPEYAPPKFTSPGVIGKPWADPEENSPGFLARWNQLDGATNRMSHEGSYKVLNGLPLNPHGRTGLFGRGHLGKWGPNHAADPVVTRWKKKPGEHDPVLNSMSKKPVLQFVAIRRGDSGEWAIPGGMVDPGEKVSITLKREFLEEATNSLEVSAEEKKANEAMVAEFFKNGQEIYRGYVDDPRNTDNAWMETVAVNFHDEEGNKVGAFPLCAGDDAVGVKWMDVGKELVLYASHVHFLQKVAQMHGAHW